MKKLITSLLVLVIVMTCGVALLASCEKVDYDHTIVFYSTQNDDLQKLTATVIKTFEDKFPGWKVDHQQPGGYDEVRKKIVQDLQGQSQPDLAYCYPDHVALYMPTQKVVDLSTMMTSTEVIKGGENGDKEYTLGMTAEQITDFIPSYYEEGKATMFSNYETYGYNENSMLTLPFVKSTELLFYNKDALDACGLQPAKTWDELWEQAPILKKKFPTATVLGYDSESNWFITESERQGWGYTSTDNDKHYLFSNDKAAAWLDTLQDKAKLGYVTTQTIYGSYTSNLFKKGVNDNAGGAVYCIGSSGGAKNQATTAFNWGVSALPGSKLEDGTISNKVISQGPSLVMLKNDQASDPDAKAKMTFMFMKELYDAAYQASVAKLQGYNPCIQSAIDLPAYQEFLDNDSEITAISAKIATSITDQYFTSPAFIGSSEARAQVGNVIVFVLKQEKDGAKALRDALKNCGGNNVN